MIRLTRLNNQPLTVNSDLIKFVEESPDTLITLLTGEKIVVRESIEEVLAGIVAFRRAVIKDVAAGWDSSASHVSGPAQVPGVPDTHKKESGK